MSRKIIWGNAIFLTLFVNVLSLPLWTESNYCDFVRTFFNKEARLDLLYSGEITQAEPFQYKALPKPFYASWMYGIGNNVHRDNLSLRAKGKWQRLSVQLKAQRDGKITVVFRGPDVRDEYGLFYSVLTDWQNIKINGKTILPKRKAFSFKKNFAKQLSVKRGDILHIEAEFRRHHFSIHDFTWLRSGKVWYIITGDLLFFSLIYLLLTYLAKRRERVCLGDMLLLIAFFLLLFIPMIGISDAVKSVREKRELAVKPKLKDIFKEKSDYGRRYENWFNDHFCGRVPLMKAHDVLRNKLSSVIRTEKALYFKENGWHFLLPLVHDLDCSPSFVQSIVQNLVQLNQFCQQHRIKLYVLEVPRKASVYKEIIKKGYGIDKQRFIKASQTEEALRKEAGKHHVSWIYPYKVLCDASEQDLVFFKESTHWTDWGAFVGYSELMKKIHKDFPDTPIVSLDDYRKTSNRLIRDEWCRNYSLWFPQRFFNLSINQQDLTLTNYYDHKNGDKMIIHVGQFKKDFSYPLGKRKIMLLGTSNSENFMQFLPYTASQTRYIRLNRDQVRTADVFKILKLYKKDILAFKPDILILSIHTDNLPRLRDLCSKD